MATSLIKLDPEFLYIDEEVSVSLTAGTWTFLSITNDNPTGYRPFNAVIYTGSSVSLRNDVVLLPVSMANFNRIALYAISTVSGTLTIRKYYARISSLISN